MVTLFLIAACDSASSPPATEVSTASKNAAKPPAKPSVGDCRYVPDSAVNSSELVEMSRVVDCSSPHTVETVEVLELYEAPTARSIEAYLPQCYQAIRSYIEIPTAVPLVLVPLLWLSTHPVAAQADRNWVRCDVGLAANTHRTSLAILSDSLKGAGRERLPELRPCLDVLPVSRKNQTFVSCTKPHLAETTTIPVATPVANGKYPHHNALTAQGERLCAATLRGPLRKRLDSGRLVVYAAWQNRRDWEVTGGGDIGGLCWYYRANEANLPPL